MAVGFSEAPEKQTSIRYFSAFLSPLCRKITFLIFLSVVIIEIIILFFSYQNQEQKLLASLEHTGHIAVTSAFSSEHHLHGVKDVTDPSSIFGLDDIIGVTVFENDQKILSAGQNPVVPESHVGKNAVFQQPSQDGASYNFGWNVAEGHHGSRTVYIRMSTQAINTELNNFVLRVSGLVLFISLFVTVITMSLLWVFVLRPILNLQNMCSDPYNQSGLENLNQKQLLRSDEMGDLFRAFKSMTQEIQQAALASQNAQNTLENQVTERTSELEKLNQKLSQQIVTTQQSEERFKKANNVKSEFLASMSHELRTPLNSILGFSQLLEDDKNVLNDEQKLCIANISKAGSHLLELINQILDLSKIEAGSATFKPEHFYPREVFKECLEMFRDKATERSITMRGVQESDKGIYLDRFRFKQIVINFLSNAIKYAPEDSDIVFGCQDLPENQIYIYVTDSGSGIPEDMTSELFTPFERLHHKGSEIEGTGIGLAISKKLAEEMGGAIGYHNKTGNSSTFWLEFPTALPPSDIEEVSA